VNGAHYFRTKGERDAELWQKSISAVYRCYQTDTTDQKAVYNEVMKAKGMPEFIVPYDVHADTSLAADVPNARDGTKEGIQVVDKGASAETDASLEPSAPAEDLSLPSKSQVGNEQKELSGPDREADEPKDSGKQSDLNEKMKNISEPGTKSMSETAMASKNSVPDAETESTKITSDAVMESTPVPAADADLFVKVDQMGSKATIDRASEANAEDVVGNIDESVARASVKVALDDADNPTGKAAHVVKSVGSLVQSDVRASGANVGGNLTEPLQGENRAAESGFEFVRAPVLDVDRMVQAGASVEVAAAIEYDKAAHADALVLLHSAVFLVEQQMKSLSHEQRSASDMEEMRRLEGRIREKEASCAQLRQHLRAQEDATRSIREDIAEAERSVEAAKLRRKALEDALGQKSAMLEKFLAFKDDVEGVGGGTKSPAE
jgi:hypothetical protein